MNDAHEAVHDVVKRSVVQDDGGVFTAQFQREFLEHGCGGGGHDFAGRRTTGERNTANVWMLNDGLTNVRAQAVDEVEDTGGEVDVAA